MSDPVSIIAATAGLAATAYKCATGLCSLVSANKTVNQDIQQLHAECDSLRISAESFSNILRRPELATFHDAELWDRAARAIKNTETPLRRLRKSLKGLRASPRTGWSMGDVYRVIQKDCKADSISTLRTQLHSYLLVLNGIKSELSLLISGKSHHSLSQQLDDLRLEVQAIQTVQSSGTVLPTTDNIANERARLAGRSIVSNSLTTPSQASVARQNDLPNVPQVDDIFTTWLNAQFGEPIFLARQHGTTHSSSVSPRQNATVHANHPGRCVFDVPAYTVFKGEGVNAIDQHRRTPLHWAAMGNHLTCMGALIEEDVEVNVFDDNIDTPLHEVARNGYVRCANALIEASANVNAFNAFGDTPLDTAIRNGHGEVAELLVEHGAFYACASHGYVGSVGSCKTS